MLLQLKDSKSNYRSFDMGEITLKPSTRPTRSLGRFPVALPSCHKVGRGLRHVITPAAALYATMLLPAMVLGAVSVAPTAAPAAARLMTQLAAEKSFLVLDEDVVVGVKVPQVLLPTELRGSVLYTPCGSGKAFHDDARRGPRVRSRRPGPDPRGQGPQDAHRDLRRAGAQAEGAAARQAGRRRRRVPAPRRGHQAPARAQAARREEEEGVAAAKEVVTYLSIPAGGEGCARPPRLERRRAPRRALLMCRDLCRDVPCRESRVVSWRCTNQPSLCLWQRCRRAI